MKSTDAFRLVEETTAALALGAFVAVLLICALALA